MKVCSGQAVQAACWLGSRIQKHSPHVTSRAGGVPSNILNSIGNSWTYHNCCLFLTFEMDGSSNFKISRDIEHMKGEARGKYDSSKIDTTSHVNNCNYHGN